MRTSHMDSWEDIIEKDAPVAAVVGLGTDKWEGEDEDDIVESWDVLDEDEDENKTATISTQENKKPKRRTLTQIKAEKEAARIKEQELRQENEAKVKASMQGSELTAAQLQRIQEQSDLDLCKDTFGVFDKQEPTSRDDFERIFILVREKLLKYESSPHYSPCLENLVRDLAVSADIDSLKKMATMFSAMASEKQKQLQKTNVSKKKAKGKVAVRLERNDDDIFGADSANHADDFDDGDFM